MEVFNSTFVDALIATHKDTSVVIAFHLLFFTVGLLIPTCYIAMTPKTKIVSSRSETVVKPDTDFEPQIEVLLKDMNITFLRNHVVDESPAFEFFLVDFNCMISLDDQKDKDRFVVTSDKFHMIRLNHTLRNNIQLVPLLIVDHIGDAPGSIYVCKKLGDYFASRTVIVAVKTYDDESELDYEDSFDDDENDLDYEYSSNEDQKIHED